MQQKVQEILFWYRATPLNNRKTPAELYLQRQLHIQFDVLKPVKLRKSTYPIHIARQLSVGKRVQAHYYANNKNQWKLGTVIKKLGQLHYLVKLDERYTFKCHINQLRPSEAQRNRYLLYQK